MASLSPSARSRGLQVTVTVIFGVALVLFFTPIIAAAIFGFTLPGKGLTFDSIALALRNANFVPQLLLTLQLAVLSTLASLALLVPTLLWLHLKQPGLLRFAEWLSVIPYVVPTIALVSGASLFFRAAAPGFLVSSYSLIPFYMVLSLPLVYRTLDAGIRALDVSTLFSASASLGANAVRTMFVVIVPNLRPALLGASLLSVAMVLGEYALAALLLHDTFPVFLLEIGNSQPRAAAALSFIVIVATWLLLMTLSATSVGRGKSGAQPVSRKARRSSDAQVSPKGTH